LFQESIRVPIRGTTSMTTHDAKSVESQKKVSSAFDERTWLDWLVKVRVIVITFLLAIEFAITTLTQNNVNTRLYVSLILLWYAISVMQMSFASFWQDTRGQARVQVITDLLMSTAVIYVTGGIDTSFNFLYPLIIIIASILIGEGWAYITATLSFIALGTMLELSHFGIIRSYAMTRPDFKTLQTIILINLFAYMTVAYLSSRLSNRLRRMDVELQDKSGELENLQALHENIVNSISGGLITTDMTGNIKLVNAAGELLLERDESEMVGRKVGELFSDALPQGEFARRQEVRAVTPSGKERVFGMTITALDVPGRGVIGQVYTLDDLTEIRRLEREVRLRDRLAAVGRLAAGIAHEIRNPLSSIAGSVKLLSGISALNEDQRMLVDIVMRESDRLNAIITDFLVYSREKRYELKTVDLISLLEDTLTLLEMRLENIRIVRNFDTLKAPTIGDGDKLKQVFWNICENAIRAMESGGSLTVGVGEANGRWRITFADTGAGIPAQLMEKMFEPFQSNFEGGTGLGLAIVYQILQAHDASIRANSKQGVGTEFVLEFARAGQVDERQTDVRPTARAVHSGEARRMSGNG
jgi:two-component system sensor histidine kinase PilS (NtrC family)